jgi:multiple sugar transport system ATP-binding protein
VDDLSLDVEDGEFLVLLGPSGCGKSTVLRMIAGLETPSEGAVFIGGREVGGLSPKDRDVAMVFQNYALYPHMSVFDNMAFGLRMRKTPRQDVERRVRDAAGMLQVEHLLHRKPRELSGGERQRVALARAIVREPRVFLMDEPLSNLDAQLRVQTRSELVKLHRRLRATVIYVTHDQTEAMTMADRVAVLRGGVLQQVDEPQTMYDLPANRFVGGFIGSPGMNFFDARVATDGGAPLVDAGIFQLSLAAPHGGATGLKTEQDVVVGVRPEDVEPVAGAPAAGEHGGGYAHPGLGPLYNGSAESVRLRATVEMVEPLGSEKLLHLAADGRAFISRVDPHLSVASGDEIAFVFHPGRAHLFDAATGVRLADV